MKNSISRDGMSYILVRMLFCEPPRKKIVAKNAFVFQYDIFPNVIYAFRISR